MSGATLLAAIAGDLFNGALTIGDDGDTYGFSVSSPAVGSLSPSSYTDRLATSRTIIGWSWNDTNNALGLLISGTSIPDTDTTFAQLWTPSGGLYARSAATYDGNVGGNSFWEWSEASNPLGTSGTIRAILI